MGNKKKKYLQNTNMQFGNVQFCIGFIDFKLKDKKEYRNLFSPNDYEKNDKIILKYVQQLER